MKRIVFLAFAYLSLNFHEPVQAAESDIFTDLTNQQRIQAEQQRIQAELTKLNQIASRARQQLSEIQSGHESDERAINLSQQNIEQLEKQKEILSDNFTAATNKISADATRAIDRLPQPRNTAEALRFNSTFNAIQSWERKVLMTAQQRYEADIAQIDQQIAEMQRNIEGARNEMANLDKFKTEIERVLAKVEQAKVGLNPEPVKN